MPIADPNEKVKKLAGKPTEPGMYFWRRAAGFPWGVTYVGQVEIEHPDRMQDGDWAGPVRFPEE